MKTPLLNIVVFAIALIALGCGGAAMVAAQDAEEAASETRATLEESVKPAVQTAFVLKVDPLTSCKPWTPTDCPEPVEGEIGGRCTYEIVTSPELEDVLCLGAGCKELIGEDAEVLTITLQGEQALFCGEPAP